MKAKRRCQFCKRLFIPDIHKKGLQKVCSRRHCQKSRQQREWRRWAARNKPVKRLKLRQWAKAYPHYWRGYRKKHHKYREQDNRRRCKAMKRARKCSAKQS